MDVISGSTGPTLRHRGIPVIGKIGSSAQVPDRVVHAGGKSRRWTVQEGNIRGRSQSPVVDQRRGRFARTTGEL